MKYTQVNLLEIETLYSKLAIADGINSYVFNRSEDGYSIFLRTFAQEILKLTNPVEYDDDLFKLELCHAIEEVANQEINVVMFGKPWFANFNTMIQIINIFD